MPSMTIPSQPEDSRPEKGEKRGPLPITQGLSHTSLHLRTAVSQSGDCIVSLEDESDSVTLGRFFTALHDRLSQSSSVSVDCRSLTSLKSEMLSEILAAHIRFGERLTVLAPLRTPARESLDALHIGKVLTIHSSLEDSIAHGEGFVTDRPETQWLVNTIDAQLLGEFGKEGSNPRTLSHQGERVEDLISFRRIGGIEVISLIPDQVPLFSERLGALHQFIPSHVASVLSRRDAPQTIILNMSRVEYMNSALIGAFIAAKKRCELSDCEFILCGLSESVRNTLSHTHLDSFFRVYSALDDALE